jgi:hypothetical protein
VELFEKFNDCLLPSERPFYYILDGVVIDNEAIAAAKQCLAFTSEL